MTKKYNIVDTYVCKSKGYEKLKDCNCSNCEMADKKKILKKSGTHHFALCENIVAANYNPQDLPLKHTLSIGTIVVASKRVDNSKLGVVVSEYEKKHAKYFGKTWVCPLTSLVVVPPEIIHYILPVPSQSRVNIVKDRELCANLEALELGDEVYVLPSHGETPSKAVIKYKGPYSKLGEGIFFDVELLDKREDSPSDDTSPFPSNTVVVASDRIRVKPPVPILPMISNGRNRAPSVHQLRKKFETMTSTSQSRYKERLTPSPPPVYAKVGKLIDLSDEKASHLPLKPRDRVVWMGDDGPMAGFILDWCESAEVILHLDKPVRTVTKPFRIQYEMRVPIVELIKYEDFYDKGGGDKGDAHSPNLCEKSCQASSENQRNSQLERRPSPSNEPKPLRSEPQCMLLRNCYTGASAPPIDIPTPPPRPPTDKYFHVEEDYCDYPQEPPSHYAPARISPNLSSSSSNLDDFGDPHSPIENLDNHLDLGVGSMVEVMVDGMPYYGVIRWLGQLYAAHGDPVAGVEMEQEHELFCDGQIQNKQRFICNPKRGHFAPLFQCRRDPRFIESHCADIPSYPPEQEFGGLSCPIIPGSVPPLNKDKNIEILCGKMRGIQGHHNSCYLDATLFAMFTFTSVFDSLLFRPPPDSDSPHYTQVQQVLREEIVNPLRKNLFVRADRVMHLRHLLNELSDVSGLTSEEKDPEEFLTSLVAQILRAEPFLKLSSGQETYHYQLFVEKDEKLRLPSVQQLFEQSFFTSDIKLKEAPSCLIIQMPRFGKSYKMYPRILPSQLLDITDVLEASPRQCTICGKLAELECRKCFNQCDSGLQSIWYCRTCLERTHTHEKRTDHESCWRQLSLPDYFLYDQDCPVSRVFMELFAVVCIETSHYVAFVKGGSGCDAPWCFFDSMADRKGERNGYNIPEMVPCPELPYWLSEEGSHQLNNITDDRQLPEYAKRLMCDAYMVMYQSPDLMMYR